MKRRVFSLLFWLALAVCVYEGALGVAKALQSKDIKANLKISYNVKTASITAPAPETEAETSEADTTATENPCIGRIQLLTGSRMVLNCREIVTIQTPQRLPYVASKSAFTQWLADSLILVVYPQTPAAPADNNVFLLQPEGKVLTAFRFYGHTKEKNAPWPVIVKGEQVYFYDTPARELTRLSLQPPYQPEIVQLNDLPKIKRNEAVAEEIIFPIEKSPTFYLDRNQRPIGYRK